MHATMPLLAASDFPALHRRAVSTLQVNLGYRCNQSCVHCHVNAGPTRSEMMDAATARCVIDYLRAGSVDTVDFTGGAPELNEHFRSLVQASYALGLRIVDRCNLTVLEEPGQEDLAEFLAAHNVEIVASLPCYLEHNVEQQRGKQVFAKSIRALHRLNALGYAMPGSGLILNLMYNPLGATLPPPQQQLEADYRRELAACYGVAFNHLYTLVNMPIARFGSTLISKGQFDRYLALLRGAFRSENLNEVMCRTLISVDWQGYVYDCDFNQMLGLPLTRGGVRQHLRDLTDLSLAGESIAVADHCYGCTAGQGSSCGGALN
jgi:radical SAM/Cys-rich protein